jgi:hypothetical protein
VFFYNWLDKRVGDYVSELEAAAGEWVALVAEQGEAIELVGKARR